MSPAPPGGRGGTRRNMSVPKLSGLSARMAEVTAEPFSFTRLSLYEACPRRWFEVYVLSNRAPDTEATVLGHVVHEALSWTVERMLRGERPGDFHVRQKVESLVQEAGEASPHLIGEYTTGTAVNLVRTALRRLPSPIVGGRAEEELRARVDDGRIVGRLDLQFEDGDTLVVRDWKTGRTAYGVEETHQLGLYGALLRAQRRAKGRPVRLELHFLRTDEMFVREADDTLLGDAARWAAGLIREIRRALMLGDPDAFQPKAGRPCAHCHVADTCPLVQVAKATPAEGEVEGRQEAQAVARSVLLLEGHVKALMERLRRYVDREGALEVDGEIFGYAETVSRRVRDLPGLFEALKGLDEKGGPWAFLQVNWRKLGPLITSGDVPESVREAVRKLVTESHTRRFGHRQAGDEDA